MSFPFPISPSQINTARLCWRKYGWEYIDQVERTSNEYAELGTEMHTHLENWFRKRLVPPDTTKPGQMAISAIEYHPFPTDIDEIELHIEVETEHAQYHGYQDLGYATQAPEDLNSGRRSLRVVTDHKSCGDFKWNNKPADLLADPQGIIYAAAAMVRHGVTAVLDRWVYTTRNKGHETRVVEQLVTQADVEAGFDSLDDTAKDIYYVRSLPIVAMDLPPNPSACGAMGGCTHVDRCKLTPAEKMRGYMAQETLRDRIKAQAAAKQAGQTIEKPAGKPVVAQTAHKPADEPEVPETPKERLKRIKQEKLEAEMAAAAANDADAEDDEEEVEEEELPEEAPIVPPKQTLKEKMASKPASTGDILTSPNYSKPLQTKPRYVAGTPSDGAGVAREEHVKQGVTPVPAANQQKLAMAFPAKLEAEIMEIGGNGVATYYIEALDYYFDVAATGLKVVS